MIFALSYRATTTCSSNSTNRRISSCGQAKVRAVQQSSSWFRISTQLKNWNWLAIAWSLVDLFSRSMVNSNIQCILGWSKKCYCKYSTRLKIIQKASPSLTTFFHSTVMMDVYGSELIKSWINMKKSLQPRMISKS